MPEALTINAIFKAKRNAAAVRLLAARTIGSATAVQARAMLLPADAADQREAVLRECKRARAEALRYARAVEGMPDAAAVGDAFAPMFVLSPGLKSPAGYAMITPIPLWPIRAAAMTEALEEHARDMEGAFLRALAEEAAKLPETAREAAVAVVEGASSWIPVAVIGLGVVAVGGLALIAWSRA